MKILFIADVIGSPGREVVQGLLPDLRRRHDVDLVICNGENSAGGFGLTQDSGKALFAAGVDVLTGGNHLWDRKEAHGYLANEPRLVRPANMPLGTPGQGWGVFTARDGTRVGIVNLLGRVFMKECEDPFRSAETALENLAGRCDAIFVDFHAETTAEKVALAWHLDGRIAALVGTHTHVQTADERVLPNGTAFLCDAGMTGGFESVIGMDRQAALQRFLTLMPARLTPSSGDLRLNGCVVDLDPATGRARSIERLQIPFTREAGAEARRLTGDEPAAALRGAARVRVAELRASGAEPRLALVSVGEDAASQIYLKRKTEACLEVGIDPHRVTLAAGTDTRAVIERVRALAADPAISGILVQLPLAAPAEADAVLEAVPPHKDVDGFHPVNAGRLAAGLPGFVPATPRGVLELLHYYQVPLAGRHAVILGRSNIVGRPLANLLSGRRTNMTVTVGHSGSGPRLRELARGADLLVAAIGRPEYVDSTWVKPGATVVDVGIHRVPDPGAPRGSRLTGDLAAADVARVAGAFTPVPGGVGPMTVAALMANVVQAVEMQRTEVGASPRR